jgi:hypothetical protein
VLRRRGRRGRGHTVLPLPVPLISTAAVPAA